MTQRREGRSSSVERAIQFLGLVAGAGAEGIALSAVARASGLPVSTCHRYVTTLVDAGALRRDSSGRLFLGPKLISLAQASLQGDPLRAIARPVLEELAGESEETIHLGRPTGEGVVYLDKIDSVKAVRLASRIGAVVPYHCSAMGKAILAILPSAEREEIIARASQRFTEHTLTGQQLRDDLAAVAEARLAFDEQEFEEGVRCVGAAVVSSSGELLGAISVSGPASRFSKQLCAELAPKVLAAAERIGQESSWPDPHRSATGSKR